MNQKKITQEQLFKLRKRLTDKSNELLKSKGNDYSGHIAKETQDTLFNLRVAAILGIVPNEVDSVLVRLSDKFMRLISLTRPGMEQQVTDESLEDTIVDIWNYSLYALAFLKEQEGKEIE